MPAPLGCVYAARVANVRLHELLGQPGAGELLRGIVISKRPAHAYLFQGAPGVGKGTAALAFARALLCERPEDGDACGACGACHKTATLSHPDLRFLFPVTGEEKDLDETIAETLEAWREDPLFVFSYEKAASIRLSLTRELIRELTYEPFEAARRVVVVRDADRMREDQYSAMLKSLEEPGGSTVWILTTARPSKLPATIRSRCQRVRFAALPEALLRQFLSERVGIAEREARILAALSGGSLAKALVLRDAGPLEIRDQALALLEPALRGDGAGLWRASQKLMDYGRTGRENLRRMFEVHQLWLRDLLRAQAGAERELFANRDREAEIRRQAARIDAREIRRRLMVLEEALQSIDFNVTPDLTVFSAMARVAGARFGENEWPAHTATRWDY
jgi:DNA polymerase III subunit delta'